MSSGISGGATCSLLGKGTAGGGETSQLLSLDGVSDAIGNIGPLDDDAG